MAFDFNFTTLQDIKQLRELVNFVDSQDLGYPGYHEWVSRTEAELASGYKQSVIAYSDRKVVGDLIFQPHKSISSLIEIKNFRIDERFRMRAFGRFLMRQLEVETSENYSGITVDVREGQKQTIDFFSRVGFTPRITLPLYGGNEKDIVFVKLSARAEDLTKSPMTKAIENYALSRAVRN